MHNKVSNQAPEYWPVSDLPRTQELVHCLTLLSEEAHTLSECPLRASLFTVDGVLCLLGKASVQPEKVSINISKHLYLKFSGFTFMKSVFQ